MRDNIRVNLKNVISLLGKHLYTTTRVAVRELIQNARDSVHRQYGGRAQEYGRITIETIGSILSISDNGSGMDRKELREYLSTLGDGIKQAEKHIEGQGSLDYIGEFGLGFFSSFMIADW